jgi:uncharacterized membrane protein
VSEDEETRGAAGESAKNDDADSAVALGSRAFVWLSLIAFSLGTALALTLVDAPLGKFLARNRIAPGPRYAMLGISLGVTCLSLLAAGAYAFRARHDRSMPARLLAFAERLSPLALVGFVPVLLLPKTWSSRPLTFLALSALLVFTAKSTLEVSQRNEPLRLERWLANLLRTKASGSLARLTRLRDSLPFALVLAATLGYVVYFSYYTIVFHEGVYSSFDLGIKNNIFWNTLHGNPLKASVTLGPDGPSHFGRHADLLVYLLLPIYYFHQAPETILALQATFMGAAAIPLYLLASRRLGAVPGALVALSYLLHPALHGGNLFEFHFIGFGLPLLFGVWAAFDRGRYVLAAVLAALTLLTREDVALWITIFGLFLIVTGRDPKAGLVTTAISLAYFTIIKFWLMPMFGGESFADYYSGLPPEGDLTFKGVLVSLVGNPTFTLGTLLKQEKLVFLLQIFLPLAALPFSRPVFYLLAVPGFLFTILSPDYSPLFDIAFQYAAHFLAFAYPGLVLALEQRLTRRPPRRIAPLLFAVACGTLAVSFQFGAVLQQHTAYAGPRPFHFGLDEEGERRRDAIRALAELVPPDAKIACSNLIAPQFSSREDAYDMTQGFFDADYLVFTVHAPELRDDEVGGIRSRLSKGKFGVVASRGPFALAKRGHATKENRAVLSRLGKELDVPEEP